MRSGTGAELRHPRAAALLFGALTLLTSCGFLTEMADPPVTAEPALSATATAPPPAQPSVVLDAQLEDDRVLPGSPFRASVQVWTHPVVSGLPPLAGFGADCGRAADATRYLAVDVTVGNRSGSVATVAADLALTGPTADAVGVFVESGHPGVRYCQDGDRMPTTDHLAVDGGVGSVTTATVFVVAGPEAPAEPFTGLTLELTGLRNTAWSYPELVTVGTWTAAAGTCPDQPDSLCAELG